MHVLGGIILSDKNTMEIPMSSKEKKNRVGSLTMGAGQNKVETVLSIHHKLGIDARSSLIE